MTSLIIELAAKSPTSIGKLHDQLGTDLMTHLRRAGALGSVERCVLSLKIRNPEMDAFDEGRGWSASPDAVIQLGFDGTESAIVKLPEVCEAIARYEEVADPARTSAMIAEETVVVDDLGEDARWPERAESISRPVKMVVQNWKRSDISLEEYRRHWREVHAPLVRQLHGAIGLVRYVQSHRAEIPEVEELNRSFGWRLAPNGGLTEAWWPSADRMGNQLASEEGTAASAVFAEDEIRFTNASQMTGLLSHETLLINIGK